MTEPLYLDALERHAARCPIVEELIAELRATRAERDAWATFSGHIKDALVRSLARLKRAEAAIARAEELCEAAEVRAALRGDHG